jgi:sugar transferase (PEP-CTERM system associated)
MLEPAMVMARAIRRSTALIASEGALILGAVVLAGYVRLDRPGWPALIASSMLPKALLIAVVCQLCLYYRDLYEGLVVANRDEVLVRLFQGLGVTSVILATVYFWFPNLVIGRGVFVAAVGLVALVISSWRVVLHWATTQFGPHERLLLVGTDSAAVALAGELCARRDLGAEVVGFVDSDTSHAPAMLSSFEVIGTIEDIPAIVRARSVDRVVVSLADARGKLPMAKLLEMRLDGVQFAHLASVYEEYTGRIAIENLRPSWLIFSSGFHKTRTVMAAKRLIDVVAATMGIVLSLPLQLLIAVAVKATSPGPIMYWQQRVGLDGRIFTMAKFRSMRRDAEAETGAVWARVGDDRVTPIGRFLRRMRLDELPQLWNILIGDMSLIGPRPERPEFVAGLTRDIPFYGQRHVVKPGLSGWAQVRYTYAASVEDAMKKLQYDLFYIKHMSIWLDVYIIFRTVKIVLLGRGAC